MQFNLAKITLALTLAGSLSMSGPASAGAHSELLRSARMWEAKDRTDLARTILEKALSIEADPQVLLQLGDIELRSGNTRLAADYLRRMQRNYPQHPDTLALQSLYRVYATQAPLLTSARLMARAGQTEEAAKIMLQLFPDGPPPGALGVEYFQITGGTEKGRQTALNGLIKRYQETGDTRYRLAWLKLRSAKNTKPEDLQDYEVLAATHELNRQSLREAWWAAINHLPKTRANQHWVRHYLKEFPDDQNAIDYLADLQQVRQVPVVSTARVHNAGLTYLQQGRLDDAERALQGLLSRHPLDAESLGGMGLIRMRQGNQQEALRWFGRAAGVEPGSSKWRSLIHTASFWGGMKQANALLDAGKSPEALQAAKRALAIEPDNADGLALLGNIYAQQQNLTEAERLYREALKRDATNSSAMRGLLTLLARTDRSKEAQTLIAGFRKNNPQQADRFNADQAGLLRDEADALIAAHRPSHAMQALETALLLSPRDAWIRHDLAGLYQSLGLPALSLRVMAEGAALAPDDPAMNFAYALVLTAQDHEVEALARLARIHAPTEAMKQLETRAWLNLRIRKAQQLYAEAKTEQVFQLMFLAERRAADQPDAIKQVTEGWFSIDQPARGLALMKPGYAKTAASQLYYASLLNRAKQDQALAALLPDLYQRTDWDDAQRDTLLGIETDLTARQVEQWVKQGDQLKAAALAARVPVSGKPGELNTQKAQVRLLMAANDGKAALPILQVILSKHPDDLESGLNLAQVYVLLGDKQSAQHEINQLHVPENDLDSRLSMVRLEVRMNNLVQARQMIATLLGQYPDNPDVLIQAGRIERSDHQYLAALNYFHRALQSKTDSDETVAKSSPLLEAPGVEQSPAGLMLHLSLTLGVIETKQSRTDSPIAETVTPVLRLSVDLMNLPVAPPVHPGLPDPVNKIAALPRIGRAEEEIDSIEARRDPRIEMGYEQLDKNSTDGTSSYHGSETPLVGWWPVGYDGHGFLHVDQVSIDAGTLQSANASDFGQIAAQQVKVPQYSPTPIPQTATGTSVGIGYQGDDLRWDMGVIGMGFPVQNLVGGIRQSWSVDKMDYALELSRRPQTSSLLSYAGARDPVTGEIWGGVTHTGVSGRAATSFSQFNASVSAEYGWLQGKNVLNNTRLALRTSIDKDVLSKENMKVNLGLTLTHWRFRENEAYYTFGQGGYYSPQSYTSLSIPAEWTGRENKLSYRVQTSVSYSQSSTKDALYYPTDPLLQQAVGSNGIYTGGPGNGIGYALRLAAEYRLTPYLAVGGNADLERSAYYAPNSIFFYLRYWFKLHLEPVGFPPVPVKPYSAF